MKHKLFTFLIVLGLALPNLVLAQATSNFWIFGSGANPFVKPSLNGWGLLVNGSTTLQNFTGKNGTTTSFGVLNLAQVNCDVKATVAGSLYCDTAITPANISGGVDTNIQFNQSSGFGGNNGFVYLYNTSKNVGIGTSSPFARLSVVATSSPGFPYFTVASTTNNTFDTLFTIASSTGNVGIGTSTPGSLLSIGNTQGWNFTTATSSSFATGGINLNAGCYAINGVCVSGSSGSSGNSFAFPFTPTTNFAANANATTSIIWFQNGFQASTTNNNLAGLTVYGTTTTTGLKVGTTPLMTVSNLGQLDVSGSSASLGNAIFDTNSGNNLLVIATHGGQAGVNAFHSGGTATSPTATTNNNTLYFMGGRGYTGSAYATSSSAVIGFFAAGTQSPTNTGSFMTFNVTKQNDINRNTALAIADNGNILVGTSTWSSVSTARLDVTGDTSQTTDILNVRKVTSTATTTAFNVTSTGNVGIGTTTPSSMLSVHGGNQYIGGNSFIAGTIKSTSSSASTFPYASTTSFTSAGSAYLGTNGSYLGFGTVAPTNPFSFIYSDNNFANGMILRNSNAGTFAINGMQFQGSDSSAKANFAYFSSVYADPTVADKMAFYTPNTTTGLAFVTNLPSSSGNTGDIRFSINNPGSSLNGITIRGSDGSGNVGVGTTSPYKILSVQGLGSATTTIVHGGKSNPSCDQYFSPNGTAYRTYMSNAGALTTEAGFCQ